MSNNLSESVNYRLPIVDNTQICNVGFSQFIAKGFQSEIQLLLFCLSLRRNGEIDKRIKTLVSSDLDWEVFIDRAVPHTVIPLVYKTLSEYSAHIPSPAFNKLKNLAQINSFNNLYLTKELLRLLNLMEVNGVRALPHKGPVLAQFAYGDVSLRQFCDLDILVPKEDVLKTKELFRSINYLPKTPKTDRQDEIYIDSSRPYNYKFISENGRVNIELHWKFTSRHNSFSIDYDRILKDLITVKIAGRVVPSLRTEDLLVILCQHGSKHFWTRLLWICDIAWLIHNNSTIDWNRTINFSTECGAKRMLLLGLNLSRTLLNAALPDEITEQIKADRKVEKLSNQIIKQLSGSPVNTIQDFKAHIFSYQMRERWRDKMKYSAYHLLSAFDRAFPFEKRVRDKMK